jgi:hypothetical protein
MAGIKEYDTTAGNNSTINSIDISEGCAPSGINNAIRQILADSRSQWNDANWFEYGDGDGSFTIAYASGTSFTVNGIDVTSIYHAGRRVRAVGSSTGTIYGTISSSSFSTNTTVNVTWDSGSLSNESLTISLSILSSTNSGIPVLNQDLEVNGEVLSDKAYIAESTLTDGATINWDMSTESVAKVTLGGNRTLAAPTNGSTGQFASLLVIQDGTGSRTLTWNAAYEFASDTAPTLTTTASQGDLFVFRYNGSKWLEVGRNLNLALS